MKDFKNEIKQPSKASVSVDISQFGASCNNPDNYQAFCDAIAYCKAHDIHRLTLSPGVYKISSPEPISFEGFSNFTFDGRGAEIRYSYPGTLFSFSRCDTFRVKELTIDWDWDIAPLATVVEAAGLSPQKDYADFRLIDRESLDLTQNWVTLNALDPFTLTPGCEDGIEFGAYKNDTESFSKKEYLGDGVYRCYCDLSPYSEKSFEKGRFYLVRHYLYNGVACDISNCAHITFENVTIFSGSGHGFLVSGHTHHLYMNRCRINLKPGTSRKITTTADGFHVAQSNGYLLFENCDFGYQGDDCINIHDNVKMFLERINPKTIRLKGMFTAENGEKIEFRNPDLSPTGIFATVEKVSYENSETTLTFLEPLPELREDCILYNRSYGSSHYIIRGCHFHETRARGVLLQANDGLVENCRFYKIQGAAIQIETGASRTWSEGMGVDNLVIRNNFICQCDANDWGKAVLYMSTFLPFGVPIKKHGSDNPTSTLGDSGSSFRSAYPVFTNIQILDNIFCEYPRRAMILTSFDGLDIKGNIFSNKIPWKHNPPERGSIWVEMGKNIQFENNLYDPSGCNAPCFVEYDPETMPGQR